MSPSICFHRPASFERMTSSNQRRWESYTDIVTPVEARNDEPTGAPMYTVNESRGALASPASDELMKLPGALFDAPPPVTCSGSLSNQPVRVLGALPKPVDMRSRY